MTHAPAHPHSVDLTEGNIAKNILLFALPLVAGQMFQNLYNTVDSIVVSRCVGLTALAAVTSCADISRLLVGFFTGLSVGSGVAFSRYFGSKDFENLHKAIQTALISFSNLFVQRYVNGFGTQAMAGAGAGKKIDEYVSTLTVALGQSSTTYVGQCMGTQKYGRAYQGIRCVIVINLAVILLLAVPIYIFAQPISGLFTDDAGAAGYAVMMVRTLMPLYILQAFHQVLSNSVRGFGHSGAALVTTVAGLIVCRQIYLAAATGHEFAILRGKRKDILFHGTARSCTFEGVLEEMLLSKKLMIYGHSHPGQEEPIPSGEDKRILRKLGQKTSRLIAALSGVEKEFNNDFFEL